MDSIAITRTNSIGAALDRTARRNGARTALTCEGREWSFAGLRTAARRVARRLSDLGLRPGDRVAAYGRNSDAYVVAWLGCAVGGFIHVPVNYALTGEELSYIVGQSGARMVLFDADLGASLEGVRATGRVELYGSLTGGPEAPDGLALDVLAVALDGTAPDEVTAQVSADDVAQLLYTSGTTAAPKGAMMTHGALLAEYQSAIHDCGFERGDRSLAALPLYHSAQMHVFLMPQLLIGATTLLIQAPALKRCLELIERHRITSFFAPPTVWVGLLRHGDFDRHELGSLQKLYYGASIMPVPVLQELRQRLPNAGVYNCYGQSEIGPLATVLRPEEHEARPASAGRPVLNVETRVVDPEMRDVPPGTHGEIVHRSPQLMAGYWGKEAETAEAFAGGWFHSGDVGYLDEEGYLYIVDRIKDVINTGGVLVASREVEEALYTHPAVAEVAVVALPDPKWIEAISAFIVLREGRSVTPEELIEHCRGHLAHFKLPKRIEFLDQLPRNTAGKLLKRELRKSFA
ncbi:fatty acyl-CoA synthetase [Azospirillum thermophilum]|uniref:3-methylmercaptopropionyl-CoA ligase n=1 Tax=Azospirillum thermophilum TaxID=2202148 RepID=A0A2S2CZ10_9PROT|nr:fatty acyl-CoA synthetase [Azospirillum thermophilum]AWK89487.1 acyl-CoA synthetase [Azospirillum thermophilum]